MSIRRYFSAACCALILLSVAPGPGRALGDEWYAAKVKKDARCTVCGMFVAKYPAWITRIKDQNGRVENFDGVKDMMVYYHNPAEYGGKAGMANAEVMVKDYYSLKWIDGRKAYYVIGSDVYGPMGQEFIPFATREAAESFLADHKGKKIIGFEEITPKLVESMRAGHRMM